MSAAQLIDIDRLMEEIPGIVDIGTSKKVQRPPAPEFPAGVFPPHIDRYIAAAARSIPVPMEMIAVPMLVIAGSTIGNRLHLVVKRGWNERPTLWAAVISPPGTAKSPATLAAQWPINELQKELVQEFEQQKASFEDDLERWSEQPKGKRGAKPVRPEQQHLYTSNITIEALVSILPKSHGVAILMDEVLSWIASFDAYRGGKGGDRQQYLSLWSNSPIKQDRKGSDSIYVANPVAGIYGGIQPDMTSKLHDPNGGRDGLVERLLLFDPDVRPSPWTDDDIDPELMRPVLGVFRSLLHIGTADHDYGVRMTSEAKTAWVEWFNDNANAIESSNGLRRGFLSKMPSQIARFALILNTLWNIDDPQRMVTEERMRDAIALGEFFISHLDRVLPLIGDTSRDHHLGLNGRIMRILKREASQEDERWVRRAVITARLGNVKSEELTGALETLAAEKAIESRSIKTATRPAEEWRIIDPSRPDFSRTDNGEVVF